MTGILSATFNGPFTPRLSDLIGRVQLLETRDDLRCSDRITLRMHSGWGIDGVELDAIDRPASPDFADLYLWPFKDSKENFYRLQCSMIDHAHKCSPGTWIIFICPDGSDIRFQFYFTDEVLLSQAELAGLLATPYERVTITNGSWQRKFIFRQGTDGVHLLKWKLWKIHLENSVRKWA